MACQSRGWLPSLVCVTAPRHLQARLMSGQHGAGGLSCQAPKLALTSGISTLSGSIATHCSRLMLVLWQVYLAEPSHAAEIMTAKSSEMNIVLLHGDDREPSEHALPEQFLTQYRDGKFTTIPVSHAGG